MIFPNPERRSIRWVPSIALACTGMSLIIFPFAARQAQYDIGVIVMLVAITLACIGCSFLSYRSFVRQGDFIRCSSLFNSVSLRVQDCVFESSFSPLFFLRRYGSSDTLQLRLKEKTSGKTFSIAHFYGAGHVTDTMQIFHKIFDVPINDALARQEKAALQFTVIVRIVALIVLGAILLYLLI